jgi:CSLREA domain-containing protein
MKVKARIVSGVVVMLVMVAAQVSPAATITVNTTADNLTGGDGQCTLREALANVNAAADTTGGDCPAGTGTGDTVTFTFTRRAGIRLSMGQLTISRDVQIVGPPGKALYVNAAGKSRVLTIAGGATAAISDVTLERGADNSIGGGGIVNNGTLFLTNCTLANNRTRGGRGGDHKRWHRNPDQLRVLA